MYVSHIEHVLLCSGGGAFGLFVHFRCLGAILGILAFLGLFFWPFSAKNNQKWLERVFECVFWRASRGIPFCLGHFSAIVGHFLAISGHFWVINHFWIWAISTTSTTRVSQMVENCRRKMVNLVENGRR